jgi:hypothetical protein
LTARSLRAPAARNAATVSGDTGSAVCAWAVHQSQKRATAER